MDSTREREMHFAQAQEIANVGSWHLDLAEGELDWSDECYRIFGIPRGETVTYEQFLSLVHPEDREYVETEWAAALDGNPYDIEHRIVVDGETRWVREKAELEFDEDGTPLSGIGVVNDVTENKLRERKIREQKRRYHSLFESIQDAILVVDDDQRIVNCNSAFTDLFGYELAEITGTSVDHIYADEMEFDFVDYALDGAGDDTDASTTVQLKKKSGQEFPAAATIFERIDEDGESNGVVGLIRDISDREDRLTQMKVIDRVLRHNLRNDLNVIQGFAETAEGEPNGFEAGKILQTSQKLLQTASKWREITSFLSSPPKKKHLDVVSVVESVVSRAERRHPEAQITAECPPSCRAVSTRALHTALEELVDNAVVHSSRESVSVAVRVELDETTASIQVVDDGDPIPEMERRVLSWEEEIEPLYHGSGLGLWLVNLIVRQSDGVLSFDENDPSGNVVTIQLPRF
ncbi:MULTISPECIES: HAMP domain-containing sensor histidine kinase [Haloferax]|uniref:histidine kinase n=1 Tax=Haloferax marinum TaxID=2666143 RepID=A0A6A8G4I8_9EURY|nr:MULTISPECIES: HAMP domain-containing sensor histidine kinase [Haloferax]KAB1196512.1 PAS domain S-box protein [Haloferax sp. CBA1150]MRW95512.1 PAS domain S-box protein [Haloferax marinum]